MKALKRCFSRKKKHDKTIPTGQNPSPQCDLRPPRVKVIEPSDCSTRSRTLSWGPTISMFAENSDQSQASSRSRMSELSVESYVRPERLKTGSMYTTRSGVLGEDLGYVLISGDSDEDDLLKAEWVAPSRTRTASTMTAKSGVFGSTPRTSIRSDLSCEPDIRSILNARSVSQLVSPQTYAAADRLPTTTTAARSGIVGCRRKISAEMPFDDTYSPLPSILRSGSSRSPSSWMSKDWMSLGESPKEQTQAEQVASLRARLEEVSEEMQTLRRTLDNIGNTAEILNDEVREITRDFKKLSWSVQPTKDTSQETYL